MTDAELRTLAEHRQRSGELIEPRYMIPLLDRIDAVRAAATHSGHTHDTYDEGWVDAMKHVLRALDGTDSTLNPRWAT
jgi:hypothetical protein